MAPNSFPDSVALVLAHEGGFVDHSADPGGATNFGITRATLALARGRPTSSDDVRRLAVDEARAIYRRFYWDKIRGDDLPAGLDLALFDFAVHSGPARAARTLQALLGVVADGTIGPESLAAAARLSASVIIRRLTAARLAMLDDLPASRPFGRGWRRRVLAVEAQSLRRATRGRPDPHS